MSVVEVLLFGTAVQLSAGVVVMINVVMSGLEQTDASTSGGK
jgi:hypothetical protein